MHVKIFNLVLSVKQWVVGSLANFTGSVMLPSHTCDKACWLMLILVFLLSNNIIDVGSLGFLNSSCCLTHKININFLIVLLFLVSLWCGLSKIYWRQNFRRRSHTNAKVAFQLKPDLASCVERRLQSEVCSTFEHTLVSSAFCLST